MTAQIASPKKTQEIIKQHGFSFKKSLGQNFLIDQNILDKIAQAAELSLQKGVIEIGPGIGALTERLAEVSGKVVAIEIDNRLIPILHSTLDRYSNVEVIHGDVLQVDFPLLIENHLNGCEEVSVVANLPYYVTTPIIMGLIESKARLRHIVVMVQKEVADRLTANPGGKDYGSLSIALQYYCQTEWVTSVPRTVFIPQPNVDSSVIKITFRDRPAVEVDDETLFFRIVKASFAQRRKTLSNNLVHNFMGKERKDELLSILQQCQIDPQRRGETLSMKEYALISNAIGQMQV
jgi:16S rRNA (adenine1518-N6/adenine1519-N6)-dimethyltransferase